MISCSSTQKIKYFQDIPDSGKLNTIPAAAYTEPKIHVDDILTVIVETIDPQSSAVINLGNIPSSSTGTSMAGGAASLNQQFSSGYLVNKEGFIEIPILGRIKVSGYTTAEATDVIKTEVLKYYKNPTVIVRYANFKINVTGEVLKPGVYVLPNEKVTILDAIALAGDLTIFGKRENVLLIRENPDGTKTPYRINLKKSDIMVAPYYYLRQNDVIYVEPRKAKSDATDASQQKYITIAGALLSIILVLAYRVK
jgi:polysaccharide export outer membrane protein